MSRELIINASLPEIRIALVEDGKLQEILIERSTDRGVTGNIYKGRVTRVLPGMQAAFVDIGLEKAAFLFVDDVYTDKPRGFSEPKRNESPVEAQSIDSIESMDSIEETVPEEGDLEVTDPTEAMELPEEPEEVEVEEEDSELDSDDSPDIVDEEKMGPSPEDEETPPEGAVAKEEDPGEAGSEGDKKRRRGRRGGKNRKRPSGLNSGPRLEEGVEETSASFSEEPSSESAELADLPAPYADVVADQGSLESDRAALTDHSDTPMPLERAQTQARQKRLNSKGEPRPTPPQFREPRGRDRRIRPGRSAGRPSRGFVNIQDLLKEGQEVLVQVAKDPIATKGARLTCHLSLPGRHLVCMPTMDTVGVSRRIEREDERRRFREFVERHRPRGMGFIVRTASIGKDPDRWIKQDIQYLEGLVRDIFANAEKAVAPALIYEDLNSVLRSIRDWVNEDIDKIIVDSRYYFNEIQAFVARFMPSLGAKIELYQGDIPIFDAYGISTELNRSLERRVWLKSGGYIVIDQAEALVAIDVNTGRYVGKKNLEDTILKTNLEAAEEIAYQLRLRNAGGIIILDFIDMEKDENRIRVYRALEEALKKDRARPMILKISELGLVEMTRKRTRDTMVRALCEPCAHCEGKGFLKSKKTVAYEVLREIEREGIEREIKQILIQAHPDVIDILAIDERGTIEMLEKRYRKDLYLQAMLDYHPEQYEVAGDKQPGRRVYEPARPNSSRDDRRSSNSSSTGIRPLPPKPVPAPLEGRLPVITTSASLTNGENPNPPVPQARVIPAMPVPLSVDSMMMQHQPTPTIAPVVTDPDMVGNIAVTSIPVSRSPSIAMPSGDSGDEEDRLAFLRAQAAQDAALAAYGASNTPALSHQNPGRPGGQGRRFQPHSQRRGNGGRGGGGGGGRGGGYRGGGSRNGRHDG